MLTIIDTRFSRCRTYRWTLSRSWMPAKGLVNFIGLNPSTADEVKLDPTCSREVSFANKWGYGAYLKTNLFGYRATNPKDMKDYASPVGGENNYWIQQAARAANLVVLCWGTHGSHLNRANVVLERVLPKDIDLYCLKLTQEGFPQHPLYLKGDLRPMLFREAE